MKYTKFAEYLDQKNQLRTTAKVTVSGDFESATETKPAKEEMPKDAGGKGQVGEPAPYKGSADEKDPNSGKLKDGFNSEPKTMTFGKGGNSVTWPKTKTQEWIDQTKGLSLAEFTKAIREENIKGLEECECQDSTKEVIKACKCNAKIISNLVREAKRQNVLENIVLELLEHSETFQILANKLNENEIYSRRLNLAMETVAPPIGMDSHPMKQKFSDPSEEDMDNEENPDDMDDLGDEEGMEDEENPDDMGDNMGMEDEENPDDMGDNMGMEDEENPDDMGMEDDEDMHGHNPHHQFMKAMQKRRDMGM